MINLYIDFDGVIVDTIETSYRMLKELKIDTKDYDKVGKFYSELNWKEFLNSAKEINNSFENIKKLVDSNLFYVNILTHVTTLHEAEEKIKFLRKHLEDITIITVPKKISKTKMVSARDAILVDDYSKNLVEWEKEGGIGIRFNLELEGKGFYAIDRLDKIIEFAQNKI